MGHSGIYVEGRLIRGRSELVISARFIRHYLQRSVDNLGKIVLFGTANIFFFIDETLREYILRNSAYMLLWGLLHPR